jgi:hypothetical protein
MIGAFCLRKEEALSMASLIFPTILNGPKLDPTVCNVGFTLVSTTFSLHMSYYLYTNTDMGAD